ncbi:hypothetical protein [Actinomadura sp. 9N215]|uniref:hypothetical protein n=1 Tax=Actinomadura sp. 9N215 TaxID=3375150 RepID=UPI00379B61C5
MNRQAGSTMSQRKTPMSAVSVATSTRDDLNRLALDMGAAVGKRVSMNMLVSAMLGLAESHRDDLIEALTPKDTES